MSEEKLRQDMEILHRIGDELIQAWKLNDENMIGQFESLISK